MKTKRDSLRAFLDRKLQPSLHAAGDFLPPEGPAPERTGPLDILIPIFNGADLLRRCLEALLPTLHDGDTVWLIDDASEDSEIGPILADFATRWAATEILRNPENLGFVGSSNRGMASSHRDLVLLNSDTEPCEDWLEQLQACLERNPKAGIVCPVSDNATLLSVLPPGGNRQHVAATAARYAIGDPQLPTAVGFCMLIRRRCLDEVGFFSQAFAPGYGEENDLSMRALRAGWDILAADRACVYHHSGGSFDAEKSRALRLSHEKILNRVWPEYGPMVGAWWRDNPLRAKTERLAIADDRRPRILHVLHRRFHIGGTERVTRELVRSLSDRYEQTLVYPGTTANPWCDMETRSADGHRELMLNKSWIRPSVQVAGFGADLDCPQSERAFARLLKGLGASVVHFHHLLQWDSLLLPALARKLGSRVVISVHDFWFNCPVFNQLEYHAAAPCGRSQVQADARCSACLAAYTNGVLPADDARTGAERYAAMRQSLLADTLENADAVLVPSKFLRDRLIQAFPGIRTERLRLEPHGTRLPDAQAAGEPRDEFICAYFGGDQRMKGSEIVLSLALAMAGKPIRFRIFGRIKGFDPDSLPPNVELAGFYAPDDVGKCLEGADLALLPSFYEESFSMIASECWAHGVPVLASNRGALKDRVEPGVNGWLVPDMQFESWRNSLQDLFESDAVPRCRQRLKDFHVRSDQEAFAAVDALYRDLLAGPLPSATSTSPARAPSHFRKELDELRHAALPRRSGVSRRHFLGVVRDHWGTAGYRVRFPLEDIARAGQGRCDFHVVRSDGFSLEPALLASSAGSVVTQPFLSDRGLQMLEWLHRESGFETTLVIDDLWTQLNPDNPVREKMPGQVAERLAYAASLSRSVVLTTAALKRELDIAHDRVFVINNALPGWIWNPPAARSARVSGKPRIGWSGAPQHAGDLAFLAPVMKETRDLADWVFLGMCLPQLEELATEVHPMVPFDQYPAKLASLDLDLAIAPLADTPFNRCKSHLKVLEYGILGLPVIAADLEPYRDCPVPKAAPDDPSAWIEPIRNLLLDGERRREAGGRLEEWVRNHHMSDHRRSDWQRALGG